MCVCVQIQFILFMLLFVWAAGFCSLLLWSYCGSAVKQNEERAAAVASQEWIGEVI